MLLYLIPFLSSCLSCVIARDPRKCLFRPMKLGGKGISRQFWTDRTESDIVFDNWRSAKYASRIRRLVAMPRILSLISRLAKHVCKLTHFPVQEVRGGGTQTLLDLTACEFHTNFRINVTRISCPEANKPFAPVKNCVNYCVYDGAQTRKSR